MRISDWSSDVCSSDLIGDGVEWENEIAERAVYDTPGPGGGVGALRRVKQIERFFKRGAPGGFGVVGKLVPEARGRILAQIAELLPDDLPTSRWRTGCGYCIGVAGFLRSEERGVGKECVSTC